MACADPVKTPAVTRAMVRKNTASVTETLQHRWSRLGGPQPKPVYTRSYTQTREDPIVRNEKLNGKKSVGIKIQTRLDEGILVADIGTGDYLREEFVAHQELPKVTLYHTFGRDVPNSKSQFRDDGRSLLIYEGQWDCPFFCVSKVRGRKDYGR